MAGHCFLATPVSSWPLFNLMRRKFLFLAFRLMALDPCSSYLDRPAKRQRRDQTRSIMRELVDTLLTMSAFESRAPDQPTHALHLGVMTQDQCVRMCRFDRDHLFNLCNLLRLPAVLICSNGTRSHISEALPIFLYRLAKNPDFYDMERDFWRKSAELKVIFSTMVNLIADRWVPLLTGANLLWTRVWLLRSAQAISAKLGLPLPVVLGFVDGKIFDTCRPVFGQEAIFNGKDRSHGLKFLGTILACGLLLNWFGPAAGRRHDAFLYHESELYERLDRALQELLLALFGDSAFPESNRLIKPFTGVNLSPFERAFNDRWCSVRVSVEWFFGRIVTLWRMVDDRRRMKVLLSPVAKWVQVAALLTNLHHCFYGSLISSYFACPPPSPAEYLNWQPN